MTAITSSNTGVSDECPSCSAHINQSSNFCTSCGTSLTTTHAQPEILPPSTLREGHPNVHGFSQMLGLHPFCGVLTLAVNAMLFGGTVFTMGALIPIAIGVGVVLGVLTYRAQMKFYQDDAEAAALKAGAVALITMIPVGLPALLTVPSTVIGFVHTLRRKG